MLVDSNICIAAVVFRSPEDENCMMVSSPNKALSQSFENLLDDNSFGIVHVRVIAIHSGPVSLTGRVDLSAASQWLSPTEVQKGSIRHYAGQILQGHKLHLWRFSGDRGAAPAPPRGSGRPSERSYSSAGHQPAGGARLWSHHQGKIPLLPSPVHFSQQ